MKFFTLIAIAAAYLLTVDSLATAQPPSTVPKKPLKAEAEFTEPLALPETLKKGKLELRDENDKPIFSFKPKEDNSAKLYDAAGKELCKLKFSGDHLKVKNADEKPLVELKRKDGKISLRDASGEKELFKLKQKPDELDVYNAADHRLYRLRKKENGYVLENDKGQVLFHAKIKEGKSAVRDANDKNVLHTKDLADPMPLLFFQIKELSVEQQAACFLFFLKP